MIENYRVLDLRLWETHSILDRLQRLLYTFCTVSLNSCCSLHQKWKINLSKSRCQFSEVKTWTGSYWSVQYCMYHWTNPSNIVHILINCWQLFQPLSWWNTISYQHATFCCHSKVFTWVYQLRQPCVYLADCPFVQCVFLINQKSNWHTKGQSQGPSTGWIWKKN